MEEGSGTLKKNTGGEGSLGWLSVLGSFTAV